MRVIAVAATAAVTLLAPTTPANATVTGAVLFSCEAKLPAFPAVSGIGGTCSAGLVPAAALGVAAGIDDHADPYVVTGLGTFSARFDYAEGNCAPGPVPATGTAEGDAWITGLTGVHGGLVEAARVDTHFTWTRVGLVAVVITTNTRVTFSPSNHIGYATQNDVAVAAFLPEPVPGTCTAPAPTRAVVVGVDVVPV